MADYVGQPLTDEVLRGIFDEAVDLMMDCPEVGPDDSTYDRELRLTVYPEYGVYWKFYKDGVELPDPPKNWNTWLEDNPAREKFPQIPDSCQGGIIADWKFDPTSADQWEGEVNCEDDGACWEEFYTTFTVSIYVS